MERGSLLSVLVPLLHPIAYVEHHLLHALPTALPVGLRSEVILSPASTSAAAAYNPERASRNHSTSLMDVIWLAHQQETRGGMSAWQTRAIDAPNTLSCASATPSAHRFATFFETCDDGSAASRHPSADLLSLSAALNRAALVARGHHLLLLDELAEPRPGFLPPLRLALSNDLGVGIVGGRGVDARGRIKHAGLGVALGQLPYRKQAASSYLPPSLPTVWSSSGGDDGGSRPGGNAGIGTREVPAEMAVPVARWRGLPREGATGARGESRGGGETVHAVDLSFMLLSAHLWRRLGGLNTSFPPDFAALDLCLRAAADEHVATLYVNTSMMHMADAPTLSPGRGPSAMGGRFGGASHAAGDGGADGGRVDSALAAHYEANLHDAWRDRWGPTLASEVRAGLRLNLTVIWNMECGGGQVRGFTDEAITFATALEGLVDLKLEVSEAWHCEDAVLSTLPASTRDAILRMQRRTARREDAVLIVHRDPGRYRHFVQQGGGLGNTPLYEYFGDDDDDAADDDEGAAWEDDDGMVDWEDDVEHAFTRVEEERAEGGDGTDARAPVHGTASGDDDTEAEVRTGGEDAPSRLAERSTAHPDRLRLGEIDHLDVPAPLPRGSAPQWRHNIPYSLGTLPPPPPPPLYVIGRSMFETSALPSDWADQCNQWADELWLPSEFNRDTFAAHGVHRKLLQVMPQPIDMALFDAQHTPPMALPGQAALAAAGNGSAPFVFLSVFKWEERKGWDALLRAYLQEFEASTRGSDDHVALYLRVSTDESNKGDLAAWLAREMCAAGKSPEGAAAAEEPPPPPHERAGSGHYSGRDGAGVATVAGGDGGAPPDELRCVHASERWRRAPPVILLDEAIPQAELPSLYKAADAFVLPTRGEGWGRPVMEAMAMGLPAIVTNWSGTTAFISDATAYPLPYELKAAPTGEHHYWAEPSVDALRRLMRRVVSRRDEARAVGEAARRHVAAHYSQAAVADRIVGGAPRVEILRRRAQRARARGGGGAARSAGAAARRASVGPRAQRAE